MRQYIESPAETVTTPYGPIRLVATRDYHVHVSTDDRAGEFVVRGIPFYLSAHVYLTEGVATYDPPRQDHIGSFSSRRLDRSFQKDAPTPTQLQHLKPIILAIVTNWATPARLEEARRVYVNNTALKIEADIDVLEKELAVKRAELARLLG